MNVGFRKWILLENKKTDILKATEDESFPEKVYSYLSVAVDSPIKKLENKDWQNTLLAMTDAMQRFAPDSSLPLLQGSPKNEKPADWDYEDRAWAYHSHVLSKAYGWTLEYIADLEVNEALAHLQEIYVDEQLEQEFEYGLSEVAYQYEKSTKTSKFVPMKRPYFMRPKISTAIKKVRIRRDMLPIGRIIDISGMPEEFAIPGLVTEKG